MDLGHDLSQAMAHGADHLGELSFGRRRYTRDLDGVDIAVVAYDLLSLLAIARGSR